jgi:hypothetical protein
VLGGGRGHPAPPGVGRTPTTKLSETCQIYYNFCVCRKSTGYTKVRVGRRTTRPETIHPLGLIGDNSSSASKQQAKQQNSMGTNCPRARKIICWARDQFHSFVFMCVLFIPLSMYKYCIISLRNWAIIWKLITRGRPLFSSYACNLYVSFIWQ